MVRRKIGWGLAALLALLACEDNVANEGDATLARLRDARTIADARRDDAGTVDEGTQPRDGHAGGADDGTGDDGGRDLDAGDGALPPEDAGSTDDMRTMRFDRGRPPVDMALPVDMEPPPIDMEPPPIVGEPCTQGPGRALVRFHYDNNSNSPRVDVWDVPCDYSIRINDACGVFDRCRGGIGCSVGRTNTGAVALDGSDDLLIWFALGAGDGGNGTVHLLGRSLCAAASTFFELVDARGGWGVEGGPVGQQFEYQWHSVPIPLGGGEAAMILTAGRGCGSLGVQAIEVCVP